MDHFQGANPVAAPHFLPGLQIATRAGGQVRRLHATDRNNGDAVGACPTCECVINKVVRRADLEAIRAKVEVTVQQADPRLVSRTDAPLNVTFTKEDQTHVKARK